jgi:hypothetical protein
MSNARASEHNEPLSLDRHPADGRLDHFDSGLRIKDDWGSAPTAR